MEHICPLYLRHTRIPVSVTPKTYFSSNNCTYTAQSYSVMLHLPNIYIKLYNCVAVIVHIPLREL